MKRRIVKFQRARLVALAVGAGVLGSLGFVGQAGAVTLAVGSPMAGGACQSGAAGPAIAAPSAAPTLSTASSGGTVADGTYQVEVTYVNGAGETTASASASITTASGGANTNTITINSPPAEANALGWYAYVTQVGGSTFTRQQTSPTTLGTNLTLTAPPTTTGANPPTTNTATTPGTTGKINGRGSTLQLWLQFAFINAYATDVCGAVPADSGANVYSPPSSASSEPTGDPTGATSPIDQFTANAIAAAEGIAAPPAPGYNADGMVTYNYPSAQDTSHTGSGAGRIGISCRTDALTGTDVPYNQSDISKMDSTEGAQAGGSASCPINVPPFQNIGISTDAAGATMSFPIGVSAIAMPINLPSSCLITPANGVTLTTTDVAGIWGGSKSTFTTWGDVGTADTSSNIATTCTVPITRVVRHDGNSGTTQGFLNYLNDAAGSATPTCSTTETVGASTIKTGTFGQLDLNATGDEGYSGENNVWPGQNSEAACTPLARDSSNDGGPFLLAKLEATSGGIGYVDVSDVLHDTQAGSLFVPKVQASDASFQLPYTGSSPQNPGGSNCTFGGSAPTLPTSGVGLTGVANTGTANGDWALDQASKTPTAVNPHDDVAYSTQGGSYPICSLTWDFAFAAEDGNIKATSAASSQNIPGNGNTLQMTGSEPADLAQSGTANVNNGFTITYHGVTNNNPAAGSYTLNNVQYAAGGTIAASTPIYLPSTDGNPGQHFITGNAKTVNTNPQPELTANQRRTLFSYVSYMLSDPAQSTAASNGYAQLPEAWLSQLRSQFQRNF